jgi:hypothetical protein
MTTVKDLSDTKTELINVIKQAAEGSVVHPMGRRYLNQVLAALEKPDYKFSEKMSFELLIGSLITILAWEDKTRYFDQEKDAYYEVNKEGKRVRKKDAPKVDPNLAKIYYPSRDYADYDFNIADYDDQTPKMRFYGHEAIKTPALFNRELLTAATTLQIFPVLTGKADKIEEALNHFRKTDELFYTALYQDQLKKRKIRTILVIIAAIVLTPLSLLISLPLWLKAKRNETIQKIETSNDVINNVRHTRDMYWKKQSLQVRMLKQMHDSACINNDKLSSDKKPKKVIIAGKGNNVVIYTDKFAAQRFNLFKNNAVNNLTLEQIDSSKMQSRELIATALSRKSTV